MRFIAKNDGLLSSLNLVGSLLRNKLFVLKVNECCVYFAFDGKDFEPDEITRILDVVPTAIKRKGKQVPGRILRQDSWILSTPRIVGESIDVYELTTSIIKILEPKTDKILDVRERFKADVRLEVVLWIAVQDTISTPVIGFAARDVKFLAKVGAHIDIDTYKH